MTTSTSTAPEPHWEGADAKMANVYTNTQFQRIRSSFVCCYATLTHTSVRFYTEGDPENCANEYLMKELFLVIRAMDTWSQNENGSTTGYTNILTQQYLNDLINRGKDICGCC